MTPIPGSALFPNDISSNSTSHLKRAQPVLSQDTFVTTEDSECADIVGFGVEGVSIGRYKGGKMHIVNHVLKSFGQEAGGWSIQNHVRLLASTTSPWRKDIVGFGSSGVWVAPNLGNNVFGPPKQVLEGFYGSVPCAGGWSNSSHIRLMADVRKTGYADIVGFAHAGVYISDNVNQGEYKQPRCAVYDFGNEQGWRVDRHLRFLADVTGDGFPDIVGFGDNDVIVGVNNKDGTFQPGRTVLDDFCHFSGDWWNDEHPRFLADLTGNGRVDIIGFKNNQVFTSLNQGSCKFGPVVSHDLGLPSWTSDEHVFVVTALARGEPADIVLFGEEGVYIAKNMGNGTFKPATLVLRSFGERQGWDKTKHPRFVADLTRNGYADIIGFGGAQVFAALNQGDGTFGKAIALCKEFAYLEGWQPETTVRYVANLYRYN
ncbi:Psathyrella Velutina lectin At 1.5a resolution, partial [Coprinopsis marcescibilis]